MRGDEENRNGHVWKKNEKGEVDVFALECDPHNGPECEICEYSFCEHCVKEDELDPCSRIKTTRFRVEKKVTAEEIERYRGLDTPPLQIAVDECHSEIMDKAKGRPLKDWTVILINTTEEKIDE